MYAIVLGIELIFTSSCGGYVLSSSSSDQTQLPPHPKYQAAHGPILQLQFSPTSQRDQLSKKMHRSINPTTNT
jgi:hypothetical protein